MIQNFRFLLRLLLFLVLKNDWWFSEYDLYLNILWQSNYQNIKKIVCTKSNKKLKLNDGDGTWGDIFKRVFFLILAVSSTLDSLALSFMSCFIHFICRKKNVWESCHYTNEFVTLWCTLHQNRNNTSDEWKTIHKIIQRWNCSVFVFQFLQFILLLAFFLYVFFLNHELQCDFGEKQDSITQFIQWWNLFFFLLLLENRNE